MTDVAGKDHERKGRLQEILATLTPEQIRFLVARLDAVTDIDAARRAGLTEQSPYKWRNQGVAIDEALNLLAVDGLIMAAHLRRRNLARAMQVKVDGLDARDQRLRQAVATEIIEWELGKAVQKQEVTGKDGAPVEISEVIIERPVRDPGA